MPIFESFRDAESYYATPAHWTRHKFRLKRYFWRKRFSDEGYARESRAAPAPAGARRRGGSCSR